MLNMGIKKQREDRLRNSFFRWIGITPFDDFEYFANDIVSTMEAFETFSKSVALFSNVICNRLHIRFDGKNVVEVFNGNHDDRGMVQ